MATDLTRIIGIGNPLMGDDGLGIRTIELLQQQGLPQSVELIDGGCGGLKLLPLFTDCNKLIIVDAADFNATPGKIKKLSNKDLPLLPTQQLQPSGHQIGLTELLQLSQKLNPLPPLSLFLVQIKTCQNGTGLSNELETALPALTRRIRSEIVNKINPEHKINN